MSLRFFEGPAGSGKTTRLFEELATILKARPLLDHERVLALTKMHGSRRRMYGRLSMLSGLRNRFECITIDRFAWRVLKRWRSLARTRGNPEPSDDDYDTVCRCAGALLSEAIVGRWAVRAFPVAVIDELQDSNGGQLMIVRALAESATCLAAADDYQDLDPSGDNPAVVWAQRSGEVVSLAQNYRTTATGLLAAAIALRDGRAIPGNGSGFTVLGAQNANMGASLVSQNLTWWRGTDDIAVITPVRAETSRFVRDLILRVQKASIGNPATGPHRIPWEVPQEEQCEQFLSRLGLPADASSELTAAELCLPDHDWVSEALIAWLDQRRRLQGRTTFTVGELHHQVRAIRHRSRAHRRVRDRGIRAMTIHQAKNREFDSVIVLWPYEVAGSADRQRRLLYNAITRAKRQALVVVQNPARLNRFPFVPDDGGAMT